MQNRLITFVLTLSIVLAPLLGFLVSPILGLVILACGLLATVAALQAVREQAHPGALKLLTLLMGVNVTLAIGCLGAAAWLMFS